MQVIPRLSAAAVDYLISFNVRAVAISPTGRVYTSENPAGAACAWWCRYDDALRLAKAAQQTGNVEAIAQRLRIHLTEHDRVLERVRERTQRLEEALEHAQANGLLKHFNAAFRKRRLAAQQAGHRFMSYSAAQRRLRQAITETIAAGGVIDRSIVERALSASAARVRTAASTRPARAAPDPGGCREFTARVGAASISHRVPGCPVR